MISKEQAGLILTITRPYDPVCIGVFGSYARGEQHKDSDLDLLIDFRRVVNLLDLIGIEQELTEKLGIKVDLVTLRALNEQIKPFIEKDIKYILK